MIRRVLKIVLPVAILVVAGLAAAKLASTPPRVTALAPEERVWVVNVAEARVADVRPDLALFGEVVAGREVEMGALVAGQVIEAGPNFIDGGFVKKGELLVAIDPFDSRAALDESQAQLAEARARLKELEARLRAETDGLSRDREQLEITARDLERIATLRERGTVSQKALDDARLAQSRQAQLVDGGQHAVDAEGARVEQQQAVIARLEVAVRRARRDLEQTRVVAPFDGLVLVTQAELGKRLAVNAPIARVVDLDRMEVKFHLSDAQYGRILAAEGEVTGRPARASWRAGNERLEYDARVDRVAPSIDPASGGVDFYARLTGRDIEKSLRPGAFVEVRMPDRAYRQVVPLPDSALHGEDLVYVVEDGRLAPRQVRVAARVGDQVLIAEGVAPGAQVVTTRFAEIGPGLRVEVR